MPPFRAFIAVVPPETVQADLGMAIDHLRQRDTGDAVRWIAPNAMHITLAFLGQMEEESVPRLMTALVKRVGPTPAFDLTIESLGSFGARRRNNTQVIWAGLGAGLDSLRELGEGVAEAVRAAGLRMDSRIFQPHITLGRVRRGHSWHPEKDEVRPRTVTGCRAVRFRVLEAALMESQLGRGPAVYVQRGAVRLTGSRTST